MLDQFQETSQSIFKSQETSQQIFESQEISQKMYQEKSEFPEKSQDVTQEIFETQEKSQEIFETQEKSQEIFETQEKSQEIFETQEKSQEIFETQEKSQEIFETQEKSQEMNQKDKLYSINVVNIRLQPVDLFPKISNPTSGTLRFKFRYSQKLYNKFVFFVMNLLLLTRPYLTAGNEDHPITCQCTTSRCAMIGTQTCTTTLLCYSQLLEQGDGTSQVTQGCILEGGSTLDCEFSPKKVLELGKTWKWLFCCDKDFCNSNVAPTPSSVGVPLETTSLSSSPTSLLSALGFTSLSSSSASSSSYASDPSKGGDVMKDEIESYLLKYDCQSDDDQEKDNLQSIYLLVIIAALSIMIAVTSVVSCLLLNYRSTYVMAPQEPVECGKKRTQTRQFMPGIVTDHKTTKYHQPIYV